VGRQAIAFYEQALAVPRRIDDPVGASTTLNNIANVLVDTGRYEQAESALAEAIHLSTASGNRNLLGSQRHSLGDLALVRGDVQKADTCYHEGLAIAVDLVDTDDEFHCLAGLACVAALRNDANAAGRLWTVAITWQDRLSLRIDEASLQRSKKILTPMESNSAYRAGVEAGQTVSFDQAVQEQLEI
jgi:tetratricopeptide (TPR) repeat protein